MMHVITDQLPTEARTLSIDMFRDRKRVFVDLMSWNIPVTNDLEIDEFDNKKAIYLVVEDEINGHHLGSLRLLPTTSPHILGNIYPHLCENTVPIESNIYEITRFCLSPKLRSRERRIILKRLVVGMAEFANFAGISSYTGVTNLDFLGQILLFGGNCVPLGLPIKDGSTFIGAFQYHIDPDTIANLARTGNYHPSGMVGFSSQKLAA
jgi:N-acyl-L-homoserine lactone synthetase